MDLFNFALRLVPVLFFLFFFWTLQIFLPFRCSHFAPLNRFRQSMGKTRSFLENGLEAELDEELGYTKYDYNNKTTDNSRNGHSSKK